MSVGGAGGGGGGGGVGEKGRVVVDFDQTVRDFPEAVAARQRYVCLSVCISTIQCMCAV